jgi:hypothetical protein
LLQYPASEAARQSDETMALARISPDGPTGVNASPWLEMARAKKGSYGHRPAVDRMIVQHCSNTSFESSSAHPSRGEDNR